MKRFEVGKLYSCSEHFLMLYPDKETASAGATFATSSASTSPESAVYWSEVIGKPVSYIDSNEPFLVLCTSGLQAEVLVGDKKGWIINEDWLAHHVEPV